ncbi:M56 family metallopeptidase [Prosthecobacter sp.]|jgi:beta-lactamase regulating signal transducer with metallopeptidase domain|uniref:M56 family metallopeptidase n=1 Tax=Prosthecobacter sp. TaxID=1965333 RepID=UPI0037C56517
MNADALLHWLLRTSLEASLLILAVLGLRLMLGTRLSPAWRIGLWLLVGTKLMLPAFIPAGFGLGAWFQQDEGARMSAVSAAPVVDAADVVRTADVENVPMIAASIAGVSESAGMISGYTLALGVWVMGALWVFAAALYRQRRFELELRQRPHATAALLRALVASLCQKAGVRKQVRIVLMPAGTTPAVVGMAQPSILLPEDWETRFDEHSLRHVLLHELLHVKQHDLILNWAATAVQALHWFNPLVWFVVSRFQADRELRCDAGALALLSPTERLDYGHTLLRIQESFFAPPAMTGLAPCVRNHPTLRQRIHMIAHPTTRQPVIQMLLVLTLSVLVCYSFTTARAVEKEVPAKERSREGARTPAAEQTKTGASEEGAPARAREGDGGTKKTGMREGDGGARKSGTGDGEGSRKTGMREGDGGSRKPGARDGEGSGKTGMRDGEKPRTGGEREGDGSRKTGARDGEGSTKTGMRDGEKPRTGGEREGDGSRKTGARDGDKATSSGETITLKVIKNGEAVMVGETEVSMRGLRGHLSTFLPEHPGAKVVVTGDENVPLGALHNTVDAVRDNGNKNVGIKAE